MPGIYNQEFVFFEKVKEKLGNGDDYQAFLKCLNIYNQGIIKKNELQNLVCVRPNSSQGLLKSFK
jgi:paired amphipathic helix protein Sin3a